MITSTTRMSIPITKPVIGEQEERAVLQVLRSGWLVQGPKVAEFERHVATYVGAAHAVATSNCTTALHLALVLHGVGPGDEVIVPSFTFIATANSVLYTGATPVFVDIDPRSYNIDPAAVEAAITPRTKAIMPVHQIGLAADMDRLVAVARRHGIAVIEDAAPAIGATYKGRRVGGLGNPACLSFHPRKVITTGEGGMLLTDDPVLAERARTLRAHGMSVSDLARHTAQRVVIEEYEELGYNYRMTDMQAAIGIEQLKRLDGMIERRCELARRYDDALRTVEGVQLPLSSNEIPHTYQSYMIQLTPESGVGREALMQHLLAAGIATRRGVMAIHLEPYYRQRVPGVRLPVTEAASRETVLLPIYGTMTTAEQDYVIEHLLDALAAGGHCNS
jgi:dTDP-4-amino-4,6-dideoxygalactose transaminase